MAVASNRLMGGDRFGESPPAFADAWLFLHPCGYLVKNAKYRLLELSEIILPCALYALEC
jgi:hypothetical protein